ncbi:TonB-dependent receptor [Chondrinema litorale]|uniref:TonB-dependent receptor n=1 Tax=Chondrinema litorale TaxID=2994555 RepID=UPI0025432DA8|nr:TonB-dependent receptor [Chondrinema litorale]UZR99772.1 TonB-dependent receptor [Chondrinema litorale]
MRQAKFNLALLFICTGLMITPLFAQTTSTGKIVSGIIEGNEGPLTGATVIEKGTHNGTITDVKGMFRLAVQQENPVLIIRFQGFESQEVAVENLNTPLKINLTESISELDHVIVTATRSPKDIENVPQKVKVISSKDIDMTVASDMSDLVKKTAGVDIIQYPGMLAGVGIRGFRPEYSGINQKTLVLVDGRPAGSSNLATLTMDNIERVEVLKGPASALYGAQAMGGVINIITKKSKGALKGRVFAGIGSFGITQGGFSVGGDIAENLDFDVSFNNYNQSKDYKIGKGNLFRDAFGWDEATRILWTEQGKEEVAIADTIGDGDTRPNTTYSKYNASVRLGYNINDNWRIDIKGDRFLANDVNTPGDITDGSLSPGLKDLNRYGGDVILKGAFSESNHLTAKFFAAKEETQNYRVSVNDSTTIRTQYVRSNNQLNWIGGQVMDRQRLGDHFLTVGLDVNSIEQENFSYSSTGEQSSVSVSSPNFTQTTTGLYAQGELNFLDNKLNLTAGIRYENISYDITGTNLFPSRSQNNNVITPSIGVNFNFAENLYLHSTFGTAYTTVDVFSIAGYSETEVSTDTVDVFRGNPDLENQSSQTFDIGLRYSKPDNGFSADLTFFYTSFDNNVVSTVSQYPDQLAESGDVIRNLNSYANAESTTLSGLELDVNYRINKNLGVFVNGVYILKAEEIREIYRQPDPLTLDMHNVANLSLNYGVDYSKKWFSTRLSGRYVGCRFDTDWGYYLSSDNGYGTGNYADVKYASFMVIDWVANFKLKNNQLSLMINNLTDENYYEKRGYNLMGRNVQLRYTLYFGQ